MHLNGTSAVGEWLLARERPRIYELMETYPKYNENSPRRRCLGNFSGRKYYLFFEKYDFLF